MIRENICSNLIRKIGVIVESEKDRTAKLQTICDLLKNNIPHYDWVGFYLVDKKAERELILGPYSGEPTEHTRIKFGQGICGQAADIEKTFIIDDVTRETNYLSCNARVKSEIVVPIFRDNALIGELDIDSHTPAAFNNIDEDFLVRIGELTAPII